MCLVMHARLHATIEFVTSSQRALPAKPQLPQMLYVIALLVTLHQKLCDACDSINHSHSHYCAVRQQQQQQLQVSSLLLCLASLTNMAFWATLWLQMLVKQNVHCQDVQCISAPVQPTQKHATTPYACNRKQHHSWPLQICLAAASSVATASVCGFTNQYGIVSKTVALDVGKCRPDHRRTDKTF